MSGDPYLVRWTAHALAKVEILGIDRAEIVIVYQHPDQGDRSAARVVTVWRKR